jgi:hypothetical protein
MAHPLLRLWWCRRGRETDGGEGVDPRQRCGGGGMGGWGAGGGLGGEGGVAREGRGVRGEVFGLGGCPDAEDAKGVLGGDDGVADGVGACTPRRIEKVGGATRGARSGGFGYDLLNQSIL